MEELRGGQELRKSLKMRRENRTDNNVNNYDLKLFLWDGIGTAKPLAAIPGIHKKAAN